MSYEGIQLWSILSTNLDNIFEALVGDERYPSPPPLEKSIGSHR